MTDRRATSQGEAKATRGVRHLSRLAAGALAVLAGSASADPAFALVWREADGLTLESRAFAGTEQAELRVRLEVNLTPAALADVVWSQGPGPEASRYLELREILSTGPGVRQERHVVAIPLLGRREVVLSFSRHDDASGAISIEYVSGSGDDRARADTRRMTLVRGTWRFTRIDPDHTGVEFCSVSDPGGLPGGLATVPQRLLAVSLVRDTIRRASGPPPQSGGRHDGAHR